MKKKHVIAICSYVASVALTVAVVTLLTGCGGSCEHEWQREADSTTLKHEATCQSPAVYYETCVHCGIKGETFHRGWALEHSFEKTNTEAVSVADCHNPAVYKEVCTVCGAIGEEYKYGKPLGHDYINIASVDTLVERLNCSHPNIFVKSCSRCGEKGEETFTLGSTSNHTETNGDEMCDVCLRPLKTYDDMDTSNKSHVHILGKEEEDSQ